MQDLPVAHWRPLSLAAVLLLSACAQQAPLTETAMPLPTVPMSPVANKQAQLYGAQAMAAPAAVGMDRRAIILPPEYRPTGRDDLAEKVCDYVAGMTDRYALTRYQEFFMPRSWMVE